MFVIQADSAPAEAMPIAIQVRGRGSLQAYVTDPLPTRVTLQAGHTAVSFSIATQDNDQHDANPPDLLASLSPPAPGALYQLGTPAAVELNIWDNDPILAVTMQGFTATMPGGPGPITEGGTLGILFSYGNSWPGLPRGADPQLVVPVTFTEQGDFLAPELELVRARRSSGEDRFTLTGLPTAITMYYGRFTALESEYSG